MTPFGDRADIYHCGSLEAVKDFAAQSVDMVFIDADHSYEGTAADLEAWWPIVVRGGWLGGHDYANPDERFTFGVDRAVGEFAARHDLPLHLAGGLTWWVRKQ